MKNKLIDCRTPFSLHNWIFTRNNNFSRYILYGVADAEEKEIQNKSIFLHNKELPIFECYANENNGNTNYLLITTHYLISIVDNISYRVDIEDITFDLEIEDIIKRRKERTEYIENIKYDLHSSVGIIPVWLQVGICENIFCGIFNQLNFLKGKYGIKHN